MGKSERYPNSRRCVPDSPPGETCHETAPDRWLPLRRDVSVTSRPGEDPRTPRALAIPRAEAYSRPVGPLRDAGGPSRYCPPMRLRLCGTRGSTPAPGVDYARYGGQTSCVAVMSDDGECRLILDAGTGLRRLPAALDGAPFSGSILLTHLHWDHTHGLPFCPSVDNPDARTTLYIPEQPGGDAEEILARAMSPPHFPIRPREMRGAGGSGTSRPANIASRASTSWRWRFRTRAGAPLGTGSRMGTAAIAYMPDHAPTSLGAGP